MTAPTHPIDKPGNAAMIAALLKAVAHPLRIRIVATLCREELHVNALADRLGVSQAVVSQHLQILRARHLVDTERRSGLAVYRLKEQQLRVLVACMEKCALADKAT